MWQIVTPTMPLISVIDVQLDFWEMKRESVFPNQVTWFQIATDMIHWHPVFNVRMDSGSKMP